jgi:hypothetical protein
VRDQDNRSWILEYDGGGEHLRVVPRYTVRHSGGDIVVLQRVAEGGNMGRVFVRVDCCLLFADEREGPSIWARTLAAATSWLIEE